jgi:hypothetical protein
MLISTKEFASQCCLGNIGNIKLGFVAVKD